MATITSLAGSDGITSANSMAKINTNFTNLNSDKIETSYIDTDTTLAANSDVKIPSQKAVKTYIDTSGGANASTTVRGIVEEATSAEVTAGTTTGATGARLFLNPTHVGETGNDKIVKTKSTGLLDQSIVPFTTACGVITRAMDAASGAVTTAHGLGRIPRYIRVTARIVNASATAKMAMSDGVYNGTTVACTYLFRDDSTDSVAGTDSVNIVAIKFDASNEAQNAVPTFDATNITLTWTRVNTTPSGTIHIMWEAY